ncbi:hypothetical protein GMSM_44250 [Geomonas sp. Red276]
MFRDTFHTAQILGEIPQAPAQPDIIVHRDDWASDYPVGEKGQRLADQAPLDEVLLDHI